LSRKRIINVNWFRTSNVGDTKTSPLDYYTFPATGKERISEGLYNLLRSCGSPGLSEDKCIIIKDKFSREDVERNKIGWYPGQFRQDIGR